MKKFKRRGIACLSMSLVLMFALCLGGCNTKDDDNANKPDDSTTQTPVDPGNNKPDDSNKPNNKPEKPEPEPFSVKYREDYKPTKFTSAKNTFSALCDNEGAMLVANTVTKTNGDVCVVYAIEVDLAKVDIHAGSKDNKTIDYVVGGQIPYEQSKAWEEATGGQVYASVNADFFNPGTGVCVNAFVKDGVIIKSGHNDKGGYDYTNGDHDVPASAPLLFGVKNGKAQIAPIVKYSGDITSADVKKPVIQSKLGYTAKFNGKQSARLGVDVAPTTSEASVLFNTPASMGMGRVMKLDVTGGIHKLKVLESTVNSSEKTFTPVVGQYAYVLIPTGNSNNIGSAKVGDEISFEVHSVGGLWNGYDTILGCRHALVIDDAIPSTVELENSNGAQRAEIPRTAIGIKNGKPVIFIVESLYYYDKAEDGDTHGMSVPELAEFIYYYGCSQAANFDGGGSTQLIVRKEGEEKSTVLVRSADYNGEEGKNPATTRPVANTLLITSKTED
ncbi:MAG: phosphodiester glycosidase family protein [Clostridia bacterium]|nr:phosphodiester glycosidase family protein [Clostridia bacterium]